MCNLFYVLSLSFEILPEQIKSVEWFLNGIVIKPTEKHVPLFNPVQRSCALHIQNIDKYDAGEYSCRILSQSGHFTTKCILYVDQGIYFMIFLSVRKRLIFLKCSTG